MSRYRYDLFNKLEAEKTSFWDVFEKEYCKHFYYFYTSAFISLALFIISMCLISKIPNMRYFSAAFFIFTLLLVIILCQEPKNHTHEKINLEELLHHIERKTVVHDIQKNAKEEKQKCLDILCDYNSLMTAHYQLRPREYYLAKIDFYQRIIFLEQKQNEIAEFSEQQKQKETDPFFKKQKELDDV